MDTKRIHVCPGCWKHSSGPYCPAPSRPRCSRPPTSLLVTAGVNCPCGKPIGQCVFCVVSARRIPAQFLRTA